MTTTDKFRFWAWGLFTLTAVVALGGWLLFERDPTGLAWIAGAPLIGEGSHVGKRATYKQEAVSHDRTQS